MKSYITSALNSGLGDNYSGIYKVYTTQEYLKKLGYTNLIYNDYVQPDNFYTRTYNFNDDKLLKFLFETAFEMEILSMSEKILRTGGWFSSFLFHSTINNKTNTSNKLRYEPKYR
jgi:hypothetical protein